VTLFYIFLVFPQLLGRRCTQHQQHTALQATQGLPVKGGAQ